MEQAPVKCIDRRKIAIWCYMRRKLWPIIPGGSNPESSQDDQIERILDEDRKVPCEIRYLSERPDYL